MVGRESHRNHHKRILAPHADQLLQSVGSLQRGQPDAAPSQGGDVAGFEQTMEVAIIDPEAWPYLKEALLKLGAADIKELRAQDWLSLQEFQSLRPLEQRRLFATLSLAPLHV